MNGYWDTRGTDETPQVEADLADAARMLEAAVASHEAGLRREGEAAERARIRAVVVRLQGNATCPTVRKTCQAILDRIVEGR